MLIIKKDLLIDWLVDCVIMQKQDMLVLKHSVFICNILHFVQQNQLSAFVTGKKMFSLPSFHLWLHC